MAILHWPLTRSAVQWQLHKDSRWQFTMPVRKTTTYGFARTSKLLEERIRKASETRGFSQTRLLTHWPEIAGEQIASMSRPVEISYGRGGFGATLTLLTTGANAPMLEMQKDQIREKVNAVYGYNAIARVRVTQTAASGFADGKVSFQHRETRQDKTPAPEAIAQARQSSADIGDDGLRAALERLGANIISNPKTRR